jgi:hypothetical protein
MSSSSTQRVRSVAEQRAAAQSAIDKLFTPLESALRDLADSGEVRDASAARRALDATHDEASRRVRYSRDVSSDLGAARELAEVGLQRVMDAMLLALDQRLREAVSHEVTRLKAADPDPEDLAGFERLAAGSRELVRRAGRGGGPSEAVKAYRKAKRALETEAGRVAAETGWKREACRASAEASASHKGEAAAIHARRLQSDALASSMERLQNELSRVMAAVPPASLDAALAFEREREETSHALVQAMRDVANRGIVLESLSAISAPVTKTGRSAGKKARLTDSGPQMKKIDRLLERIRDHGRASEKQAAENLCREMDKKSSAQLDLVIGTLEKKLQDCLSREERLVELRHRLYVQANRLAGAKLPTGESLRLELAAAAQDERLDDEAVADLEARSAAYLRTEDQIVLLDAQRKDRARAQEAMVEACQQLGYKLFVHTHDARTEVFYFDSPWEGYKVRIVMGTADDSAIVRLVREARTRDEAVVTGDRRAQDAYYGKKFCKSYHSWLERLRALGVEVEQLSENEPEQDGGIAVVLSEELAACGAEQGGAYASSTVPLVSGRHRDGDD